ASTTSSPAPRSPDRCSACGPTGTPSVPTTSRSGPNWAESRDSPSSGRYAATFSPRGEEVGAGAYLLLSPWRPVGLTRIALAIRLAIRVRARRSTFRSTDQ
ncbi:hypothetical protein, partial [Mesorhizobium sp.]|uniref:hypothetical protein n=1 Tax=Mesorhizobium sp. TaxID=1871066 RepID=UPI00345C111A